MKQNGVMQDLVRNVIHVHNQQVTVQPTDPITLFPIAPFITDNKKVDYNTSPKLLSLNNTKILLPGQALEIPVEVQNGETIAVEP